MEDQSFTILLLPKRGDLLIVDTNYEEREITNLFGLQSFLDKVDKQLNNKKTKKWTCYYLDPIQRSNQGIMPGGKIQDKSAILQVVVCECVLRHVRPPYNIQEKAKDEFMHSFIFSLSAGILVFGQESMYNFYYTWCFENFQKILCNSLDHKFRIT